MLTLSAFGLVAVAMALGLVVVVLRWLVKGSGPFGRVLSGLIVLLILLWMGSARHVSRQQHAKAVELSQQRRAIAEHNAAIAAQSATMAKQVADHHVQASRQLMESQLQLVRHKVRQSGDSFAMPQAPPVPPTPSAAMRQSMPIIDEGPVIIHGDPALWLWLLPVVLIVAALLSFLAVRRGRRPGGGSGLGWLVAGVAVLVLVGFFFVGSTNSPNTVIVPMEQIVEPLPARTELPVGWTLRRPSQAWSHGEPPSAADVEVDVAGRQSIDAIWDKLSGPQIKLDLDEPHVALKEAAFQSVELSPKQITAAQAKLNEAAQVLELAAEGMTESNSQGWLVVMAEALLKATAKTSPPAPAPPKQVSTAFAAATAEAAVQPKPAAASKELPRAKLGRRTPDWVLHPPGIVGEVRKYVVHAGPYKSLEECHRDLENQMRSIVQARVIVLAKAVSDTASVPTLQAMGIGTDYILRELCTEEFVETTEFDFGDMLTSHALMEFTAAQDAALRDRWTVYARRASVERVVYSAGLVVGCLALVFGLLKVDTWTRGYYTKRLFLGVPAAIIAVVALMTLA